MNIQKLYNQTMSNKEVNSQIVNLDTFYQTRIKSIILAYLVMMRTTQHTVMLTKEVLAELKKETGKKSRNMNPFLIEFIFQNFDDPDLVERIIQNYLINGYYSYDFNGIFKKNIKTNGLDSRITLLDDQRQEIHQIFTKHGYSKIFGIQSSHKPPSFLLGANLTLSGQRSLDSPEWFNNFTSGGIRPQKAYEDAAFSRRDYPTCLNNIVKVCKEYELSVDEINQVIDFFNEVILKQIRLVINKGRTLELDFTEVIHLLNNRSQ